jgi:anhydro-N-acetylmuramic acid kinase
MATGGQGAPLVPRFHQAMLAKQGHARCILNIGGIANVTVLDERGEVATAFDTGPGNCLMDLWCRQQLDQPFDRNGAWAASGSVHEPLLERLLQDPFYRQPPPRSTGTEHFSANYLAERLAEFPGLAPESVQATLLALTARTIVDAVRRWAPATRELLVCGGGRHNATLMAALASALSEWEVKGTETAGLDPDWVEAMAFAWLAAATLAGEPGNLPRATGAREEVVLGAVYPGNRRGTRFLRPRPLPERG